jgi:hypothetical protein
MSVAEPFKINLNQNLWGLIVAFASLGAAEYWELCTLYWFAVLVSVLTTASIAVTVFAYTCVYWKNRMS